MAKRAVLWQPTDEQRSQVVTMAGFGLPHEQIATLMGVTKDTLYKHLRSELDIGMARANVNIGKSLYDQAVGRPAEFGPRGKKLREELKPDRSVAIFLGKARLGMKDTQYIAATINDLDLTALNDKELAQFEALFAKAAAAKRAASDSDNGAGGG